ncbi:MAG: ABC transporter permease [Oscillochloridaceae bacterium umkhey_bin13]
MITPKSQPISPQAPDGGDDWTMVIKPQGAWFDLKLGELWQYRDLVLLLVRRDFVAQYKQTILGPLWHIVQPLLTTIVFTIVFGRIAQLPTDDLPPFLFYMAGNVVWAYFATVIGGTSSTFISNANIFGKVYFPRLAMPVSLLISRMVGFFIQFVLFLGLVAYFWLAGAPIQPNAWVLLTPVLLLLMGGLGLGCGIIISALTTRYRDLVILVSFGVQLLMYATPVVYPLSAVPEQYRILVAANPIAPLVETFRYAFLGAGSASLGHLAYSAVVTVIILVIGAAMFNRVERTFMDTV